MHECKTYNKLLAHKTYEVWYKVSVKVHFGVHMQIFGTIDLEMDYEGIHYRYECACVHTHSL